MDLHAAEALVAEHGAERVIDALAPFLTKARRARIEAVLDGRMRSVHVAIEAPSDPHNAAAVVRTCEALGALAVHVVAAEGRALRARSVTQGSFHWVQTHEHRDLQSLVAQVRARGMVLAGACMDGSVSVGRLGVAQPLCLMFGNEQRGLSAAAREVCDVLFHVPMVGMSESLNLSVSAAISLYEVMRRKREAGPPSDLTPELRTVLQACYVLGSVDPRLVRGLLSQSASPASSPASSSPSEADAR